MWWLRQKVVLSGCARPEMNSKPLHCTHQQETVASREGIDPIRKFLEIAEKEVIRKGVS